MIRRPPGPPDAAVPERFRKFADGNVSWHLRRGNKSTDKSGRYLKSVELYAALPQKSACRKMNQ